MKEYNIFCIVKEDLGPSCDVENFSISLLAKDIFGAGHTVRRLFELGNVDVEIIEIQSITDMEG